MQTYIPNYFCLVDIHLSSNNITDLYYYSGELIKKSKKKKLFECLPNSTQAEILVRLTSLNDLNFRNWKSGYDGGKYYTICSENKIEVFEVEFNKMQLDIKDILISLDEQAFDLEINELQESSICIIQDQYFISKSQRKKSKK